MKITRLEIKDFQQFKDFSLDLTYPKGHELEGKPLRKVCLIGQSGTGKTTILNVLKDLIGIKKDDDEELFLEIENIDCSIDYLWFNKHRGINKKYTEGNGLVLITKRDADFGAIMETISEKMEAISEESFYELHYYIFLPAEMLDLIDKIFQIKIENPFNSLKTSDEIATEIENERVKLATKSAFDFKNDDLREIWQAILFDQSEYEDERAKYSHKISEALLEDDEMSIQELKEKFKKWKVENPNPIAQLAESLNPYLNKFNLKINDKTEYRRSAEIKFIEIQSLDGTDISFQNWSTGTKQIILTATPLFKLDTTETVVLFDEPERSLYPDLQREIIDYYTSLAPDAQFFFATHSPVIASSFEPWEIVELKFDENGKVYRETEKYYEGEYHVDNFKFDPRYLRWDEILTTVYGLEEDGQEERLDELVEAVGLKKKVAQMRKDKQTDTEEFKEVFEAFLQSARKLGWNLNTETNAQN